MPVELSKTQVIIKGKVYDCAKDYYKLEDLMPFEAVITGRDVTKPKHPEPKKVLKTSSAS